MGLREYRRKRDFAVTPEPAGAARAATRAARSSFRSTRPRASTTTSGSSSRACSRAGPCRRARASTPRTSGSRCRPRTTRSSTAASRAIIPEGEYGGGTVVVWDQGTWEPVGDPHADYRRGALKFRLHGRQAARRLRARADQGPRPARTTAAQLAPDQGEGRGGAAGLRGRRRTSRDSVALRPHDSRRSRATATACGTRTGTAAVRSPRGGRAPPLARPPPRADRAGARRGAGEPAASRAAAATASVRVPGARPAALPARASRRSSRRSSRRRPTGDDWLHEMKFDGYRILARLERARVRLLSRRGLDWTARLPERRSRGRGAARDGRRSSTARWPCSCPTARRASRRCRTG